MRRRLVGASLAAVLLLSGCYTISYKGDRPGLGSEQSEWDNYFLWGLVGEAKVDLRQVCPRGVSSWKSQQTFVQGLIGIVTLGIYVPRSVIVECGSGTAMELRLDPWNGGNLSGLHAVADRGGR